MSELGKQLKIGDTVHWSDVNSRSRKLFSGKVTKVGSKLVTVGNRVFRLDTLATNDQYGHQSLVLDVQEYLDKEKAKELSAVLASHLLRKEVDLSKLIQFAQAIGVAV